MQSCDSPSWTRGWTPETAAGAERPCCPGRSSSTSPSPEGPAAPCGTETGGRWAAVSAHPVQTMFWFWFSNHYICQTSNSREVEYESVSSTEKRKPQLPRLTIPLILSHVLLFSNRKLRPRCPLAVAGAAVQQGGGPDAISGVYWPAGCCEAPPRPLIRVLPGRPHCLPDSSMLITQCGAVTEGGCPSARRHTEPGGSRTQLTPRNIYIHRNKHFKSLITFNHFSDRLRARSDTSTQRWFCESVHVVGSRCFRPTRVQIAAHMIHQEWADESIIICSFTVKTNFCIWAQLELDFLLGPVTDSSGRPSQPMSSRRCVLSGRPWLWDITTGTASGGRIGFNPAWVETDSSMMADCSANTHTHFARGAVCVNQTLPSSSHV